MNSPSASLGDSLAFSSPSEFEPTPPPPRIPTLAHQPSQDLPHSRQRPPLPPRLPSPRLFRDFFNAMSDTATRRQATLPRTNYQDTVHDVSRALQSANRALQNAQEAFHQARNIRTAREIIPGEYVDLTDSSPDRAAESHFISQTTHPHDSSSTQRSRRLNTLDEPVYGSRPTLPALDPSDPLALVRLWPIHGPNVRRPSPHLLRDQSRLQSIVDEEAINRQRENHSNWERTQARNRQRVQNQTPAMSPPSSSSSSRSAQQRQPATPPAEDPAIESVDLTAVDDNASLSAALAKQRQDAIQAQNPGTEAGRTLLTAYKCPVCMDTPTNATTTVCGHVFCHRCILDTLNWSIEQRREAAPPTRKVKGVCPVCRKPLDTKDVPGAGRSLVPLELRLLVKKRKRDDKGKQKLVKSETLSDDEAENDRMGSEKENVRAGKARKRESTEEALWGQFIDDHGA